MTEADQTHDQMMRRLRFRAWHRGTREMDYMMGCFFDRYAAGWNAEQIGWFADLLKEEDPDVMAWAMGTADVPDRFAGPQMDALKKLDFVSIAP